MNISIVGAGRAGSSFASALERVGHHVALVHHDDVSSIGDSALVILCVPDDAIAAVAASITLSEDRVIAHVAGSRNLDVLAPHRRVGSLHALVREVALSLAGRVITLRDDQRTIYHAAAVVASNHLVTLMGQVRTLAESIGLSLEDFLPLAEQTLSDVARLGPDDALTGPASRGDMATIDAHLAAIPESERSTYVALANAAFELSEQRRAQSRS